MTYVEKRQEFRPASGEAPFDLNEVFYSRTDTRGVITSGNYVFRRVSNYDWDELIGKPHKIIRHPDMPSGVFSLFWDQLKKGRIVGAYVKNRAKDGLHYWVYAIAFPFADGFMSARFKPSTPMLDQAKALYKDLRSKELTEGFTPAQSQAALVNGLQALGYDDYDHFATQALAAELLSRNEMLRPADLGDLTRMQKVHDTARDLSDETTSLVRDFQGMQTIPHNLRVIASRLEPTGGPISTLSQNYGTMSREISTWFEDNVIGAESNFSSIKKSVRHSFFISGMVHILRECEVHMKAEWRKRGKSDAVMEHDHLAKVVEDYTNLSADLLRKVRDETQRILMACDVMNRHVLGLSSTRIMCKIESARVPEGGDSLTDIIQQLKLYQERISTRLTKIQSLAQTIAETRM